MGNNVTFTYTITNNGDLTTGIIFTDVIPSSGATFVSANSSPGQTSCPAAERHCDLHGRNLERRCGCHRRLSYLTARRSAGSLSDGGRVTVFGTPRDGDSYSAARGRHRQ